MGLLVAAGPVAPHGEETVLGVVAVEHLFPLDPGLEHLGLHGERIAREHDEVGVLSDGERADPSVEFQHLRPGQRKGLEGLLPAHAGTHGQTRGSQEESRIGHGIIGMDRHRRPRLLEHRPRGQRKIHRLNLAARTVHHYHRTWSLGLRQLLGHLPRLADMVEHHLEAELVPQS